MKLLVLKLVCLAFALFPGVSSAQIMPNHFDPNARELELDLSSVPAIRFLSSADYPPFNYRDAAGELIGYNIDLAKKICDVLEVACTMQSWPWEQAANALEDNHGDVLLAGLAITVENGQRFDFSHVYLQFPARFVLTRENLTDFDPDIWWRSEQIEQSGFSNTVGVRANSNHFQFVRQYFPGATIVEFNTEFDALQAVQNNEVYTYFGDALRGSFWLNENSECCAFAGEAYFNSGLFGQGLAAAFPAGHDHVRRAVNVALFRLQRDGVLDSLYLKWFPISFY